MTKPELIEKIADHNSIDGSEQKIFFQLFLRRLTELLTAGESLPFSGYGKFEYRESSNKNENGHIVFITNEEEELSFDTPENEEENISVDSYFSISLGKPIIPLKGSTENEFFVPHSNDEMKRILELKVEKFIEESSRAGLEEDYSADVSDINFSFLNWKKASALNEEIDGNKEESIQPEVKNENEIEKFDEETKEEILPSVEDEIAETVQEIFGKAPEESLEDNEITEPEAVETNIPVPDDFIDDKELTEPAALWNSDTSEEPEKIEEEIPAEEEKEFVPSEENKEEKLPTYIDEEILINNETFAVSEAVKYAEEKEERYRVEKKRSSGKFIYTAIIILLAVFAAVYYYYYYMDQKNPAVFEQTAVPVFKVVIERTGEIPVIYSSDSGMTAGIYKAIGDDVLDQPVIRGDRTDYKTPEIRSSLSSNRLKGYIYQYGDGTIAVQVSSWKSDSIALSEARKYLNSGYAAFVERAELSNGTYYRVRVGGFKSLEEAEDFLK